MTENQLSARCCIAGGGPAGMMLGLLLARAGIDAVVLEKHADFLRDFRGDTIHPSTLEVVHELGLLDEFLKLPHQEIKELTAQVGDMRLTLADFTHLPTRCKFLAMMPQWDFLNFLAKQAAGYPTFRLLMETEATGLMTDSGLTVGVHARTPGGPLEIRADLVVAADGRNSIIRTKAGLSVKEFGAPIDVLWFRLSRRAEDPSDTMGRFDVGRIFISINRSEHWQCGYVIPKGQFADIRQGGLPAFREKVAQLAPYARDRVSELRDWEDVKLLTVRVDRVTRWFRPGLLLIGDAAHAMSPVGGVGINLAIQDAVATANILTQPLIEGRLTADHLEKVQKRRLFPTRATQWMQVVVQRRILSRVLRETGPLQPTRLVRFIASFPFLRRVPARLIGVGVRPEHVKLPTANRNPT